MPEEVKGLKRAPITRKPTALELEKWHEVLNANERLNDSVLTLDLTVECLITRSKFAAENGLVLPIPDPEKLEERYLKLKKIVSEINQAVFGVQSREYGAAWRNGDFDVIAPDPSLGALFIPIAAGIVILAGLLALQYEMGKASDNMKIEYKKLNSAAENFLCKDPGSELCKKWGVVKAEQKIGEKESVVDSLKSGISSGLKIGAALFVGFVALQMWGRR